MSPRPESERSDWTDLDLLTVDEAAERLRTEIAETEQRLADQGSGVHPAERELTERRLAAMRRLQQRYTGSA